jgi:hypothetical protein
MKFFNHNYQLILSINLIILFILIDINYSAHDDVDVSDVNSLIKTVNKFNRTIYKQKEVITKLKEYAEKIDDENRQLKDNLKSQKGTKFHNSDNNNNNDNNDDPGFSVGSKRGLQASISKILEYQTFYQQIEMQIAREKELRETVDTKLRHINDEELKIHQMYNDINSGVKLKVDELSKKFEKMQKENFSMEQRVFMLEKEKEKTQMVRTMNKNGKAFELEPDCLNRNSCRICLEDPKCVWCNIAKTCKPGDISGPYDASCLNSFEYSSCSQNQCSKYSSCSECIRDISCGWCTSENKCMDGTEKGSLGLPCNSKFIHLKGSDRCTILKFNFLR